MASLSSETRAQYIKVIDSILASSDLNTVSAKHIRNSLQDAVGHDLTAQKSAVKDLIMERFDLCNQHAQNKGPAPASSTPPAASSQLRSHATPRSPAKRRSPSQEEEAGSGSDKWGSATPDASLAREPLSAHKNKSTHTVKKQKTDAVDADAIYAARLQAEENLRARPMRGSRKDRRAAAPPKTGKRKERKKTTNRVRAEDDSDVDGEDQDQTEEKKVNRTSGFHKPLLLSSALSSLLGGEASLSRPQTVKKTWEYIREHELQDPSDRRQIRCDDAMRAVFKADKVHMFTMTKILNQNLYNPDE